MEPSSTHESAGSATKPNGKRKGTLVSGLCLLILLGVWFGYRHFTSENPNFSAGKQHLIAGNFDDASSAIRLAIQEQPDNRQAKGLLLYALTRQKLESDESRIDDMPLEDVYLSNFMLTYTAFQLERSLEFFGEPDLKKELSAGVKRFKDELRKSFTENRVPMRDWDDYQASYKAAARAIYNLKINTDNKVDVRAKDVASAILASDGDTSATKYLVERCAQDPDILPLTAVAGPIVEKILQEEVRKESTFINEEGVAALSFLKLRKVLIDFIDRNGEFRLVKRADLPAEQKDLVESESRLFQTSQPEVQLMLLDAANQSTVKFDPSTVSIQLTGPASTPIAVVSGYNPEKRRFFTQALVFVDGEYRNLMLSSATDGLLVSELPSGQRVSWDEEKSQLRVAIDRIQKVIKTRAEERLRPVTRYRQEQRYDPDLYQGYGGYEYVQVPYEDYETYKKDIDYEVAERGATWVVYVFDKNLWSTKELRRLWVADSSSFEVALARAESSATNKSLPKSVADANSVTVDRLIERALTEELAESDLDGTSKPELRLVRNGIFARLGYSFRDADLRTYFRSRSWYRPRHTNIEVVERGLTEAQKRNIETIKSAERS